MKKITFETATAMQFAEESKYRLKMNYCMAKALVEGRVDSNVLKYAEMICKSQKELFEENL